MLTYTDLESEAERLLWNRIEFGQPVDCRVGDSVHDDPAEGGSWGKERSVRAELLIELLTTERRRSGQQPRALRLSGARIKGKLDLEAATLLCPLVLCACHLEEPLVLDEARAPSVRLERSAVASISGRQLETRGDLTLDRLRAKSLDLEGARVGGMLSLQYAELSGNEGRCFSGERLKADFTAEGEVRLRGAHIGCRLSFDGATLHQPLIADRLRVDQDMFCGKGVTAKGKVSLLGAHIGRQLLFDGATLHQALIADGLRVDHSMLLQRHQRRERGEPARRARRRSAVNRQGDAPPSGKGFSAEGEVRLLGAHVGGQLSFDGATLHQALIADGLRVDHDMFCGEGFSAEGEVNLLGAHVGGELWFDGATLHKALIADQLQVDHNMSCGEAFTAEGEVSLPGAHIAGELSFDGAILSGTKHALYLGGARIDRELRMDLAKRPTGRVDLTNARVSRLLDY